MSSPVLPLLPLTSIHKHYPTKSSPDSPRAWHAIFNGIVETDNPIWTEYLEEAKEFDRKMVDEWNKILDVVLVYIALFTGVLTAFVLNASSQFKPDPADISNQLLVGIYNNQLAALQNNSLPYIINSSALFLQDPLHYQQAAFSNTILFLDLALAVIVSVIALIGKLWLISYSREVNSAGSPYERAMRRQEAYSGALSWKLGTIINSLPLLILIAVFLFGIFIHRSIKENQSFFGYIVGAMLQVVFGLLLVFTMAAAFIPGCPFKSPISKVIKSLFNLFSDYKPQPILNYMRWLLVLTVMTFGTMALIIILVLRYSGSTYFVYILICLPVAGFFSFVENAPRKGKKPRKYGVSHLVMWGGLVIALLLVLASYTTSGNLGFFIGLFCVASILIIILGIIVIELYKATPDTREADAVAWFLKSTSLQKPNPEYFKLAGKIADGSKYRKALLLDSLLPLLLPLITSCNHHRKGDDQQTKDQKIRDLEIYVACLAQLSAFDDYHGSFWKNEAPMMHPTIPNLISFIDVLKEQLKRSSNEYIESNEADDFDDFSDPTESKERLDNAIKAILGFHWVGAEAC